MTTLSIVLILFVTLVIALIIFVVNLISKIIKSRADKKLF